MKKPPLINFNHTEKVGFYELLDTLNPDFIPHVLSLGCGYDSIALLLEYILNPASRDFPLNNLVVVHAVVGGEAAELRYLMELIILPLMREHNIWFIQACRNGDFEGDGITILSSTRQPTRFYLRGDYELFTHLIMSGSVPQRGGSGRLCTLKFKGWVIDLIAQALFKDSPRKRFIGFNADEKSRLKDIQPYTYEIGFNANEAGRIKESKERKQVFRFPLIEMGYGRQWCENRVNTYAQSATKGLVTRWRKSYCTNCCPFPECNGKKRQKGNNTDGDLRQDWLDEPIRGGEAAFIEHMALALNENQPLYTKMLVLEILQETKNHAAIAHYQELLAGSWVDKVVPSLHRLKATVLVDKKIGKMYSPASIQSQIDGLLEGQNWAVYAVRRIFVDASEPGKKPPSPFRQTRILLQSDRASCETFFADLAQQYGTQPEVKQLSPCFWSIRRPVVENVKGKKAQKLPLPFVEEMFVVCPATVVEKQRITAEEYDLKWLAVTGYLPRTKGVDQIHEHAATNVKRTRVAGTLKSAR